MEEFRMSLELHRSIMLAALSSSKSKRMKPIMAGLFVLAVLNNICNPTSAQNARANYR
jgi:hypothetical protein